MDRLEQVSENDRELRRKLQINRLEQVSENIVYKRTGS
jgi:hypothetical protein